MNGHAVMVSNAIVIATTDSSNDAIHRFNSPHTIMIHDYHLPQVRSCEIHYILTNQQINNLPTAWSVKI